MRIALIALMAGFVAANVALSQSESRAEIPFSGTTSASQPLIEDVMQNIVELGDTELGCPMPGSLVAEVLPEDFEPTSPALAPEGAGEPIHERWTIDFCGREVAILLTFWSMEQGGTAFDLQYPVRDTVTTAQEEDAREEESSGVDN